MVPAGRVTVVRRYASGVAQRARSPGSTVAGMVKPTVGGAVGGGVYALASGLVPSSWHPVTRLIGVSAITAFGASVLGAPKSFVSGVAGAAAADAVREMRQRRATDGAKK